MMPRAPDLRGVSSGVSCPSVAALSDHFKAKDLSACATTNDTRVELVDSRRQIRLWKMAMTGRMMMVTHVMQVSHRDSTSRACKAFCCLDWVGGKAIRRRDCFGQTAEVIRMRVVSVLYVSVLGAPVGPLAMVITRHYTLNLICLSFAMGVVSCDCRRGSRRCVVSAWSSLSHQRAADMERYCIGRK